MRLLLTGAQGFTGRHLAHAAKLSGYEVFPLEANLQDEQQVRDQVKRINPTHVIHLAGISHVTAGDPQGYYAVNLFGSLTLLDALTFLPVAPQKVILASSANIYGNNDHSPIVESEAPSPISHYAMSKLAMEYMSRPFCEKLPIVITRPFNYTGVGHASNFVIPKIVDHFKQKASSIELGNLEVLREYNDVRDICQMYLRLLELGQARLTYNLATGKTHSLGAVISMLQDLCGFEIAVKSNPQFMRANEIHLLAGDGGLLERCIGHIHLHSLEQTLKWMLES
jgi:nucleoside-diphosphate-sugar epimerase